MANNVTTTVRQLTDRGVSRLEHLEVLLVMTREAEREWNAARIAASSAIAPNTAADALAHLHGRGLLDLVEGEVPRYRLGAGLDLAGLTELSKHHERDRTPVLNAFFTCILESLRSFASAFRVRSPQ